MQWLVVWRTWKTRFRTWTPRRRLDAGLYERFLSMEASLAALSDSSQGMAERRRSAVQSLKRPSIPNEARDEPEWLFSVPPGCRLSRTRWQRP